MTPPDFPLSLPWIDRLVRFDTTSRLSNLGLVETVRDHLATAGHSPRPVSYTHLTLPTTPYV